MNLTILLITVSVVLCMWLLPQLKKIPLRIWLIVYMAGDVADTLSSFVCKYVYTGWMEINGQINGLATRVGFSAALILTTLLSIALVIVLAFGIKCIRNQFYYQMTRLAFCSFLIIVSADAFWAAARNFLLPIIWIPLSIWG